MARGLADRIASLTSEQRQLLAKRLRENGAGNQQLSIQQRATTETQCRLSCTQERLYFFDQLVPGSSAYNMAVQIRLHGPLDVEALESSISKIVDRHEALRISVGFDGDIPIQNFHPLIDFKICVVDLTALGSSLHHWADELARFEACASFDLSKAPLLRVRLLRVTTFENRLLFTMHHMIGDGATFQIILSELEEFYTAAIKGKESCRPKPIVQFGDYVEWQREQLESGLLNDKRDFWKRQLAGSLPRLQLPTQRERPPVQSYQGKHLERQLDACRMEDLRALCRSMGVSLFMGLLGIYKILLFRYCGESDIVVGSPHDNRRLRELENVAGCIVNTLVLRTQISSWMSFRDVIQAVRKTCIDAYGAGEIPLETIVDDISPERDPSINPLFQTWFALHSEAAMKLTIGGITASIEQIETGTSQFDLSLDVIESSAGDLAILEYNTDIFDHDFALRLLVHFERLLESVIVNPDSMISECCFLTEIEREQQLEEWNQRRPTDLDNVSLHDRISRYARTSRDAIAVSSEKSQISYGELEVRANRLARHLFRRGVRREARVGVCMASSIEAISAILGILKAGAAYVPLDPCQPIRRLQKTVDTAKIQLVLCENSEVDRLEELACEILGKEEDWNAVASESSGPTEVATDFNNSAYVLFTSGSRGEPKGVCCTHLNLTNLLFGVTGVSEQHPIIGSLWTNIGFDVSAYEIFTVLSCGGTLNIMPEHLRFETSAMFEWLDMNGVTSAYLPAFALRDWAAWLEDRKDPAQLDRLLVGVEPISEDLLSRLRSLVPGLEVINGYGPTEATVCATLYQVVSTHSTQRRTPIGRPVNGLQVYLLDESLELRPAGVPAEIYIGGTGVARGYDGAASETAARFVPNPFPGSVGSRLYRTGDRARYLLDGNIEFLGRLDDQVKIRGVRIEPAEIELALQEHKDVKDSVVVVYNFSDTHRELVAYVVPEISSDSTSSLLRAEIEDRVTDWAQVYEQFYEQDYSCDDPSINLRVWRSSYTGRAISEAEIVECVETTVSRIRSLNPSRVLEVGCGSGLILFRVAPSCESYVGIDVSAAGISRINTLLRDRPETGRIVRLEQKAAHELVSLEAGDFDTVIINEVAQHFPSLEYLEKVVTDAVNLVAKNRGRVFLGGVRNFSLLREFHASVVLHRADAGELQSKLKQQLQRALFEENELVVDPAFFELLAQRSDNPITFAEIQLKRGCFQNELTVFKYDVVLHVGPAKFEIPCESWRAWNTTTDSAGALRRRIEEEQLDQFGIRRVPNARLLEPLEIIRLFGDDNASNCAGEMRRALADNEYSGVEPEMFWELGAQFGYHVSISWSGPDDLGFYDVAFSKIRPPSINSMVHQESNLRGPLANDPSLARRSARLADGLVEFLSERLPEAMIPTAYTFLSELPFTTNSKLDRSALPEPRARAKAEASIGPETDEENELTEIWEEVLGLKGIGVHDNFFELGGDSILSIQIVARARQAGFELTTRDVFRHQTIAELVARDKSTVRVIAEQGEVTGEVLLTPVQLWFVDQGFANPNHWNMPLLLEGPSNIDPKDLERSITALLEHHDGLRHRFSLEAGRVRQFANPVAEIPFELAVIDLSELPESALSDGIKTVASELQGLLDLSEGRVFSAAYLFLGAESPSRLLIVTHHLVVDAVSLRFILEDLNTTCRQAIGDHPIELPKKASSFRDWSRELSRYSQSEQVQIEAKEWLRDEPDWESRIPRDRPGIPSEATARTISTCLDSDATRTLLRAVPGKSTYRITEILVAALGQAFATWSGARTLWLDLEGHGRESLFEHIDVSRTVGWFTTVYPILVPLARLENDSEALEWASKRLRRIPFHGIGYGLLRYLSIDQSATSRIREQPQPEVVFNYLGQLDGVQSSSSLFRLAHEEIGPAHSPNGELSHLLEINALVIDQKLQVNWTYSENVHLMSSIRSLSEEFVSRVRSLIFSCAKYSVAGQNELAPNDSEVDKALSEVDFG